MNNLRRSNSLTNVNITNRVRTNSIDLVPNSKVIARIKQNMVIFNDIETICPFLLYQDLTTREELDLLNKLDTYIWDKIKDHIEFVDIYISLEDTINSIMQKVHPTRNISNDLFMHTEISYMYQEKFLEIVYGEPLWEDYKKNAVENINHIGALFSLKHSVIENECILVANRYSLDNNTGVELDDVYKSDIIRVIKNRYFNKCVVVEDDKVKEYYFQNVEYMLKVVFGKDEYKSIDINIFRYNLTLYYIDNDYDDINPICTRLACKKLYGKILIVNNLYHDVIGCITADELNNLNKLSYNSLKNRELTVNETNDIIKKSNIPVVSKSGVLQSEQTDHIWCKFLLIKSRLYNKNHYMDKCISCGNSDVKCLKDCDKCYRFRFCKKECKKYDNHDCKIVK